MYSCLVLHLQIGTLGSHIQSIDISLIKFLTILSSKEWYEIQTITPSLEIKFLIDSREVLISCN